MIKLSPLAKRNLQFSSFRFTITLISCEILNYKFSNVSGGFAKSIWNLALSFGGGFGYIINFLYFCGNKTDNRRNEFDSKKKETDITGIYAILGVYGGWRQA